jgi:hypothetical protein
MKHLKTFSVLAILAIAIAAANMFPGSKGTLNAQVGVAPGNGTKTVPATYESQFWKYLQSVFYRNWAPGPGQGAGAYPGKNPHGDFLKMYLNRIAAANPKTLPYGSIIIKENYAKDKKTLLSITVMYRTKGFDPKHNDWYWVKYNPNGTVARTPAAKGNLPIAGRFKTCIDCHATAKGKDFVFANDSLGGP